MLLRCRHHRRHGPRQPRLAPHPFQLRHVAILRQFAAHVAVALVNARLFETSRRDADAFETLAEIGREVASVLELDELLARIAQLTKRVIDYRTFGILILNEDNELEMKLAVQYGEKVEVPRVKLGEGLVGYAALHREPVLVADVSQDPRYIRVVPDVRSELAIPLLIKDRCIGVVDLESPELDAFSKRDVEILTLLASQAAVAIENARLYEEVRANQERLEKEVRFAQRVQVALLPAGPPKRLKGVELAASFASARELGGDFHDYLAPETNTLVVAVSSAPIVLVFVEPQGESLPNENELRERFGFTRKEAGVARLLAENLSNGEIAARLSISPHTARHHTERVLAKLGTASRTLVRSALIQGTGW